MPMKFKGPASRALDEWYSTGTVTDNLTLARDLLQSGQSFTDIIQTLRSRDLSKPEFRYPAGLAVLRRPDFEPPARVAYLSAIDAAFGHSPPVPIRTIWETGAGNTEFEFALADYVEVTVRLPLPQADISPEGELGLGLSAVEHY